MSSNFLRSFLFGAAFFCAGCASTPILNPALLRPWKLELRQESLSEKPFIASYSHGKYELLFLAAHHENDPKSDTLRLVDELFQHFNFNFLIIESIPNAEGENPKWFMKEVLDNVKTDIVYGGEPIYAAYHASIRRVPFAGGEISHKEIYSSLKSQGFTDLDVLGFYLARQIPEWVRDGQNIHGLVERNSPQFISHFCTVFGIEKANCPRLEAIKAWYQKNMGKSLSTDINTEELAPIAGSQIYIQKISAAAGVNRDTFLLHLIQDYLLKYKKVAIVYGDSHFLTLLKSIESGMGSPVGVFTINTSKP